MPFRIKGFSGRLRAQAGDTAGGPLVTKADMLDKQAEAAGGAWWQVRVTDGPASGSEGFIQAAELEEVALIPTPVEIDQERFFQVLSFQARLEEAPREYLFALAFFESGGIRNVKAPNSTAFGPFQFLEGTWAGLVQSDGERVGIDIADRFNPFKQCTFAAIHTARAVPLAMAVLGRVPSGAELYLLHLLGHSGGSEALRGNRGKPIQASQQAINNNTGLMKKAGRTATLAEVLETVTQKFQKGYDRCAELIAKFEPSIAAPAAGAPGEGDPPWLAKAQSQLGIKEDVAAGQSNPEVAKYFTATHSPGQTDDTPWCGAFVAWCIANAGDPAIAATNIGSARAASWLGWGRARQRPRRGSVGVTVPLAKDSSGHVGFVTAVTPTHVTLLAGNQREAVSEAPYERRLFVGFRDLQADEG